MTAWWDSGGETETWFATKRDRASDNIVVTKCVSLTLFWGESAAVQDVYYAQPNIMSVWRRIEPSIAQIQNQSAPDREHAVGRMAERRMREGDPVMLRAKVVETRPAKLTKKEERHQRWLNREILTDEQIKQRLEEKGFPDDCHFPPDFVLPDDPKAVLRHLAGNYSDDHPVELWPPEPTLFGKMSPPR